MEPGAGPLPRGARGASPACVPGRRGVVGAQPLITPPPATREGRSGGEGYLIRAEHLAKHYGSVHAVRDLNLAVRPGEIYGFLGPNGAGKTTTLLMLLGIERPTAGRLELFGQPAPVDPFAVKRRLGVVGESQYLYDDLSAWEYLQFFGRLYGVADAERRGQELLERLGLWDFRRLRARDHSRGMQQKLGLARALLHRPELLVLDEPVSGLDPHGIRQVPKLSTSRADAASSAWSRRSAGRVRFTCSTHAFPFFGDVPGVARASSSPHATASVVAIDALAQRRSHPRSVSTWSASERRRASSTGSASYAATSSGTSASKTGRRLS